MSLLSPEFMQSIDPKILGMILGALEFAAFWGFISVAYCTAILLEFGFLSRNEKLLKLVPKQKVESEILIDELIMNSFIQKLSPIIQGCFWMVAFLLTYQLVFEMKLAFGTQERLAMFTILTVFAAIATWDIEKET